VAAPWREDSSNRDLRYRRNRIRHRLLPLLAQQFNPNIIDTLARTAAHFADLDEYLDHLVVSLQENVVAEKNGTTTVLAKRALSSVDRPIFRFHPAVASTGADLIGRK